MNPIALQHAKGDPFAPTSWGAFGPGWLWVSPEEDAGAVTIDTAAARVVLRAATTTIDAGGITVDTQAARFVLRSAVTSVEAVVVVETAAGRFVLRSAVTSVDGGDTVALGPVVCEVLMPTATCAILFPSATCEFRI